MALGYYIPLCHIVLCCAPYCSYYFSASPHLLEPCWSTAGAFSHSRPVLIYLSSICFMCSFMFIYYYVYHVFVSLCVIPCAYLCLHMSTYVFHFLAFICYWICNYILCQVHFCDLHVNLTCAGMWAIYVFHKTHSFGPNSKFAVFRDFGISIVCLSVCFVWHGFLFGFKPFIFPHLLYMALFLPFFQGFPHFLWFYLGFCVNFWGVGVIHYIHVCYPIQTNVCTNGGIKQCVLVFACVNGCMIRGEW